MIINETDIKSGINTVTGEGASMKFVNPPNIQINIPMIIEDKNNTMLQWEIFILCKNIITDFFNSFFNHHIMWFKRFIVMEVCSSAGKVYHLLQCFLINSYNKVLLIGFEI